MDKNLTINQVKSKQDVKRFLQQFVDRKAAVVNCVRERDVLYRIWNHKESSSQKFGKSSISF